MVNDYGHLQICECLFDWRVTWDFSVAYFVEGMLLQTGLRGARIHSLWVVRLLGRE